MSPYNNYNGMINQLYRQKENLDYYVKYTNNFIKDEDAVDDKVYYYFTMIPKK